MKKLVLEYEEFNTSVPVFLEDLKNTLEYFKSNDITTPMFRGMKPKYGISLNKDLSIFLAEKPKNRTSLGMNKKHRFYNLWIDNSDEWSEFPKRAESIISTNNKRNAHGYVTKTEGSDVAVVIPKNIQTTKIAICPTSDLWYGFSDVTDIAELDDQLRVILNAHYYVKNKTTDYKNINYFDSYEQMMTLCNDLLKDLSNEYKKQEIVSYIVEIGYDEDDIFELLNTLSKYSNFEQYLKKVISTDRFEIGNYKTYDEYTKEDNNFDKDHKNNEVWFSDEAYCFFGKDYYKYENVQKMLEFVIQELSLI